MVENTILKSQLQTKEISCQNTEKVKAYKEQKLEKNNKTRRD